MGYWGYGFRPYVNVAQRRINAQKHAAKLAKKTGRQCAPVKLAGRTIARTFWGKAWCDNLEAYSDFSNRMPRGRTYVRNGSVIDLCIEAGKVTGIVSGSEIYDIKVAIKPLSASTWAAIKAECAGQITSLVELLQGKLSKGVMEIITRLDGGLFPKPAEISLDCSCPDWADMCKHVAAVLYGVGARLDDQPELLFTLREVDHLELIEQAGKVETLAPAASTSRRTLAKNQLADVFGIDLAGSDIQSTGLPLPVPKRAPTAKDKETNTSKRTRRKPRVRTASDTKAGNAKSLRPEKPSTTSRKGRASKQPQ